LVFYPQPKPTLGFDVLEDLHNDFGHGVAGRRRATVRGNTESQGPKDAAAGNPMRFGEPARAFPAH
jgi:hypothetical protein